MKRLFTTGLIISALAVPAAVTTAAAQPLTGETANRTAAEARPDIGVIVSLDEQHSQFQPALEGVVRTALESLGVYRVRTERLDRVTASTASDALTAVGSGRFDGSGERSDVSVLLERARQEGISHIATLVVTPGETRRSRNDLTAALSIYNAATGVLENHWEKTYPKIDDFRSFLALSSYDLPFQLKRQHRLIATVINKRGNEVYFDLGSNSGLQRGDVLRVFQDGDEIKDADSVTFGKLEDTVGIVQVLSVRPFYTTAEVIIGDISIRPGHYVERLEGDRSNYTGHVLSVLEDQVAISVGSNVGVKPGSYYAVFNDVKPIGDRTAFRERVGAIIINEVHEDYSTGRFTLSNHHNLSKLLVNEGDAVEEIVSPWSNSVTASYGSYDIVGGEASTIYRASLVAPSTDRVGLAYRLHGGYGETWLLGAGIQTSLNYSPNFHTGIDVLYLGGEGIGTNLFIAVEPPVRLWGNITPVLDIGYLIGSDSGGVNMNLGMKFPLW